MNNFPCRNCGKILLEHFTDQWITRPFWCLKNGRDVYQLLVEAYAGTNYMGSSLDNISFQQMSNLEYLEKVYVNKNSLH